jgi:hypothetical protein
MPANFQKPALIDHYATFAQWIRDNSIAQAKMFDGETLTATPTGAIRWVNALGRFERWDGTTWSSLYAGDLLVAAGTTPVTGQLRFHDGTATTPALGFTNNTGMGIYRIGANRLGIATGSALRAEWDASGNFSLGGVVPAAPLHVSRSASDTTTRIEATGTTHAAIVELRSGSGTTSANSSYVAFVNAKTASQTWRAGTVGSDSFTIRDHTAGVDRIWVETTGAMSALRNADSAAASVMVLRNRGATASAGNRARLDFSWGPNDALAGWIAGGNYASGRNGVQIGAANSAFLTMDGSNGNFGFGVEPLNYRVDTGTHAQANSARIAGVSIGTSLTDPPVVGFNVRFTATANSFQYDQTAASSFIQFDNGGFVFRGAASGTAGTAMTAANRASLDASGNFIALGNITAYGTVAALSDARLKANVATLTGALEKVKRIRGVSYEKAGKTEVGVIAQELAQVMPEMVQEGEYLSVAYGNGFGLLVEAIKELAAQIEER